MRHVDRSVCRIVAVMIGLLVLADVHPSAGQDRAREAESMRSSSGERYTWGVFLGAGVTEAKRQEVEASIRAGRLLNPFTNRPFTDVKVFAAGRVNLAVEGLRLLGDHLKLPLVQSRQGLEGHHFDFAICHSNGCTYALGAHAEGIMRAEHFLALGTDWKMRTFNPGELKGAKVTFFAVDGDPIHQIPAPELRQIAPGTPGVALSVPFNDLRDIPESLKNLVTTGRADIDLYPVVRLQPPATAPGTHRSIASAHSLELSYIPAIQKWMRDDGSLQAELGAEARRAEQRTRVNGATAPRSSLVPPGGVSTDITIDTHDFVQLVPRRHQRTRRRPRRKATHELHARSRSAMFPA